MMNDKNNEKNDEYDRSNGVIQNMKKKKENEMYNLSNDAHDIYDEFNHDEHNDDEYDDDEYDNYYSYDDENDSEFTLSSVVDRHEECIEWGREYECNVNPEFMLRQCTKTCLQYMLSERAGEEVEDENKELLLWGVVKHPNEEDRSCEDWHTIAVENGNVEEEEEGCEIWADIGLCKSIDDKSFMLTRCARSCMVCIPPE